MAQSPRELLLHCHQLTMTAYGTAPPTYLSTRSANALISDLRPTQFHPQALQHLNLLLDELVVLLLKSAKSLNTDQIKHEALTSVFGGENGARGLGRTAVSEAEIELRSWMAAKAGRSTLNAHENGFVGDAEFALDETVALLRAKIVSFSVSVCFSLLGLTCAPCARWLPPCSDGRCSRLLLYSTSVSCGPLRKRTAVWILESRRLSTAYLMLLARCTIRSYPVVPFYLATFDGSVRSPHHNQSSKAQPQFGS